LKIEAGCLGPNEWMKGKKSTWCIRYYNQWIDKNRVISNT
jgi:hypothetical protein